MFSMNLLDESGEIKATAFREEVDRFFEMIEVNKVVESFLQSYSKVILLFVQYMLLEFPVDSCTTSYYLHIYSRIDIIGISWYSNSSELPTKTVLVLFLN